MLLKRTLWTMAGCLALTGAAWAQTVTQYGYDAHGRLTRVERATGYVHAARFDPASNRSKVAEANAFEHAWHARDSSSIGHITGFPDLHGWSVNNSQPSGHMIFGPYVPMNAGQHAASWRLMVDNNIANDSHVASLDVYDASAGQVLATMHLTRRMWKGAYAYQLFSLPFTLDQSRAGHAIEFRVYYHGATYMAVDRVGYRTTG